MRILDSLKRSLVGPSPGEMIERVLGEPLEGTNMSLYQSIIPSWWQENGLTAGSLPLGTAALADRVWVANRCIQLNAQQIASMPLKFYGAPEPAWISSPDPNWYPNGIGDALHSIVALLYGWGFCCLYVTDTYADGFPRTWTVLDSARLSVTAETGRRSYKIGQVELDASRIVQIDRNPGVALTGTSALRAYAQTAWGLLAAGNQSMTVSQGGIPSALLKPKTKITKDQADDLAAAWDAATLARAGVRVLPPNLEFEVLSINPADLALLETQEWNARVLATAFGVPAVILNMSLQGGLTYQNPLALMQMWWLTELRTTAKRIADAFTAQMLPRGQWAAFDASDITVGPDSDDDPQAAGGLAIPSGPDGPLRPSQVAKASPAQQPRPLTAIGGSP